MKAYSLGLYFLKSWESGRGDKWDGGQQKSLDFSSNIAKKICIPKLASY